MHFYLYVNKSKLQQFLVSSHSVRNDMNRVNDTIFSIQNRHIWEKTFYTLHHCTLHYCQSFNIHILKELSNIKYFTTFILPRSLPTFNWRFALEFEIRALLLWRVNHAHCDLIGHLNRVEIDERCLDYSNKPA